MAEPQSLPMTSDDRRFLERRAASEESSGRLLLGVHAVFFVGLSALAWSDGGPRARAYLFVAAVVAISAAGWSIYWRVLLRRIRQDLAAGRVMTARVRLTRKRVVQRKAGVGRYLYPDPPYPGKKFEVAAPIFDAVSEDDWLDVRYFDASKVVARVEKVS